MFASQRNWIPSRRYLRLIWNRPSLIAACTILLYALLSSGCDIQEQQDEFAEQASATPNGYAATDNTGRILSDDEDDWRTAPLFAGKVRVDPAYPNPVSGDFVTIPVTILDFNSIRGAIQLRAFGGSGHFIVLDEIPNAGSPGAYVFNFSPGLLGQNGLHRLYLFDSASEIISYGDLLVQ